MKRTMFALFAMTVIASSSGCCCWDKLFCQPWGCGGGGCGGGCSNWFGGGRGGCGGGCCDDGCAGGGGDCGDGGCGCGNGYAGGHCGTADGEFAGAGQGRGGCANGQCVASHAKRPRNAGGQMQYAEGPPTGQVTYPYYTNRGPRDFLARNPRSIGP